MALARGAVELLDDTGNGEPQRDIRGEGDALGASCVLGLEAHVHKARGTSSIDRSPIRNGD